MSGCDCGCDGAGTDDIRNLPGLSALRWRVAPHGVALGNMRDHLGAPDQELVMRALARQSTDEPAIALLDAWAMVADVVSFYNERIANEGFLRTATERQSVRQLARTLGHELRPGVAAQVELAFEVETAPGAPAAATIPAATPVQSIPGPGQLPQTFETTAEVEARAPWNLVPALAETDQQLTYNDCAIWVESTATGVRVDDHVLVVGKERRNVAVSAPHGDDHEKWDFRRVTAVVVEPDHAPGWTRLDLDRPIGYRRDRTLVAVDELEVYRFTERLSMFGWNAPDPSLLAAPADVWEGYALARGTRTCEIDGDARHVVAGSWLVLEQPGRTEAFQVVAARPTGATTFGLSGKLTEVTVDIAEHLSDFRRNQVLIHAVSEALPAARRPLLERVGDGAPLVVRAVDPPLPAKRQVLVSGEDADTGEKVTEVARVVSCAPTADGRGSILVLEPPLQRGYHPDTVAVRANVVTATHGETVEQVLGSGDAAGAFPRFALRRAPLTYVRTTTKAEGAAAELTVRVQGVAWAEVASLESADPAAQVYTVRQSEGGETEVVFGDGVHGARLPTGSENVEATYRVGIGETGAADADQVRLPVRRPVGIRAVTNLAASHDWAPEETLDDARTNAPQRVRTLDRAVSVADYEDFARSYAGVGKARADLVWDGRREVVAVSVRGVLGAEPSTALLADLRAALDGARETRAPREVLAGEPVRLGVWLRIDVDPAWEKAAVEAAARAALIDAFGSPASAFATPVAASTVLVVAAAVPGVSAVTMPRVAALTSEPAASGPDLAHALPARFGVRAAQPGSPPRVLAAQVLSLADDDLDLGVAP